MVPGKATLKFAPESWLVTIALPLPTATHCDGDGQFTPKNPSTKLMDVWVQLSPPLSVTVIEFELDPAMQIDTVGHDIE